MNADSTAPDDGEKKSSPFQSTEEDREAARASTNADTEQQRLKAKAGKLRSKLARTLEALKRRHDELKLGSQLAKHPLPFALAGIGTLLVLLIGKFWGGRSRERKLLKDSRLVPRGKYSEQLEERHLAIVPKQSFLGEILRSVGVSVLAFVLSEVAKYEVAKLAHKLAHNQDEQKPKA